MIPRWRLSTSTMDLDALPMSTEHNTLSAGPQQDPWELLRTFRSTGKPLFASEALSAALVLGDQKLAEEAAIQLRRIDLRLRPALASRVERLLAHDVDATQPAQSSAEAKARQRIHNFKRVVRGYPRNPLAWLDLAFAYSSVGQTEKAKEAVLAAISIESNNRGVVRAASRFFVHKGEIDTALGVISRSSLLRDDPWLVSAHIATARAAGVTSKLLSAGRKMFKSGNYRPDQISELGAALATNEVEHGNTKLARRLVDRAAVRPTENAAAQFGWLETTADTDFNTGEIADRLPNAWEARTFEAFEEADWIRSCEEAKGWLCDQPFSSRPAVHGSYVAATFLEDHPLALWFAQLGYLANPKDVILANNFSVALAENDRLVEARRIFSEASQLANPASRWTLRATDGLLSYKEGNLAEGRVAYEEAKERFLQQGDMRSWSLASIYQAREELHLGNGTGARDLILPLLNAASLKGPGEKQGLRDAAEAVHQNSQSAS